MTTQSRVEALHTVAFAAALSYPLLRLAQKLAYTELDPATVIFTGQSAFVARVLTALVLGGLGACVLAIVPAPIRARVVGQLGIVALASLSAVVALLLP